MVIFKHELKNSFVKVASNDDWYRQVVSKYEVKKGEEVITLKQSPLESRFCDRTLVAFNQYDLLLRKVVFENQGVKTDFAEFIASKVVSNDKKTLPVLEDIEEKMLSARDELLKEVDWNLNPNPYYTKRINILSAAAFAVSGVCETLVEKSMALFDSDKKFAIVDRIKDQPGEVLIGLARDLKLTIGGKNGFNVVESVMKHSDEMGVDSIKIGTELRVKKSLILK